MCDVTNITSILSVKPIISDKWVCSSGTVTSNPVLCKCVEKQYLRSMEVKSDRLIKILGNDCYQVIFRASSKKEPSQVYTRLREAQVLAKLLVLTDLLFLQKSL